MFGNLLNNYFYGKAGKGDYTVADMPQNRFQLFGAVLKVRWGTMVGVNLMYIVFWLPAIIWSIINLAVLTNPEALTSAQDAAGLLSTYLLILFPCIAITGPFRAGISFVCRNWARDEHSFVWSDYWDAVKGNWKPALAVSVISGLMPFVLYVCWQFYGAKINSSFIYVIPLCLVLMVAVIWSLSEMIIYTLMVTYENKFKDLIRNAVLLTMAKLPLAIGIKLLTLVIPAIALAVAMVAPWIYVLLALILLYGLFIPAFNHLLLASYSNALCEKYLNPKIEGARTNIGLRPENWDDTEYIPQDDEEE